MRIIWGQGTHEDLFIGSSIRYSRFDLGIRYHLEPGPSFEFYGSTGLAFHKLEFDDYIDTITGTALYLGCEIELPMGRTGAFDFGIRYCDWTARWDTSISDFDATTIAIHALYRIKFR